MASTIPLLITLAKSASLAISHKISALVKPDFEPVPEPKFAVGTARVQIITASFNGSPLATPWVKVALVCGWLFAEVLTVQPASPVDTATLALASDDSFINDLLSICLLFIRFVRYPVMSLFC